MTIFKVSVFIYLFLFNFCFAKSEFENFRDKLSTYPNIIEIHRIGDRFIEKNANEMFEWSKNTEKKIFDLTWILSAFDREVISRDVSAKSAEILATDYNTYLLELLPYSLSTGNNPSFRRYFFAIEVGIFVLLQKGLASVVDQYDKFSQLKKVIKMNTTFNRYQHIENDIFAFLVKSIVQLKMTDFPIDSINSFQQELMQLKFDSTTHKEKENTDWIDFLIMNTAKLILTNSISDPLNFRFLTKERWVIDLLKNSLYSAVKLKKDFKAEQIISHIYKISKDSGLASSAKFWTKEMSAYQLKSEERELNSIENKFNYGLKRYFLKLKNYWLLKLYNYFSNFSIYSIISFGLFLYFFLRLLWDDIGKKKYKKIVSSCFAFVKLDCNQNNRIRALLNKILNLHSIFAIYLLYLVRCIFFTYFETTHLGSTSKVLHGVFLAVTGIHISDLFLNVDEQIQSYMYDRYTIDFH